MDGDGTTDLVVGAPGVIGCVYVLLGEAQKQVLLNVPQMWRHLTETNMSLRRLLTLKFVGRASQGVYRKEDKMEKFLGLGLPWGWQTSIRMASWTWWWGSRMQDTMSCNMKEG